MNEFFKKMLESISTFWKKWSLVQKLIVGGILLVLIVGIVFLTTFSSSSDSVQLLSASVTDIDLLDRISARLDQDGIPHRVVAEGQIILTDEKTARRARALLFRENLIPQNISPWDVFNTGNKWTVTELQDNVRIQQAITKSLEVHLESLDEIDSAQVILTFPEEKILSGDQNPKKASVIISSRPGVNMHEHNRIKGIENLVLFAVDGLTKENLTISDISGNLLNSNDEMIGRMNELGLGKDQLNYKIKLQNEYAEKIRKNLEIMYPNRVVIANLDLDLNFSAEKYEESMILPTVMVKDNPLTPRDERVYVESVATETEEKRNIYAGTGVHPDGPAGSEGQVSDGYKELTGSIAEVDDTHYINRFAMSTRDTTGEMPPIRIEKFAIGIFVDGVWKTKKDQSGAFVESDEGGITREFIPVPDEEIRKIEQVIKNAVNFDIAEGDKVSVVSMQFDRTSQFDEEDNAYRQKRAVRFSIMIISIIIFSLVLLIILVRTIVRTKEQARKRKEQEDARRLAALREEALKQAEGDNGGILTIGSKNADEEEMAKQIARENPENVAHLIRTWLVEE